MGLVLGLAIQLSLKHSDLCRCLQAPRQSPILCFFQSTPEVRALPSASITRLPRYSDPLRLPIWPPILPSAFEARPLPAPGLPQLPRPPSLHAVLTTPVDQTGALVGSFPVPHGLPRISGGSASTTSLSRPARASLALRPARLLTHHAWALSRGFDPISYPIEPLVSYQVLPTTTWVGPSPTGDLRRWGALRNPG